MVFTLLREYGAHAIGRCISLKKERFIEVGLCEDGAGAHASLEFFECFVLWFSPVPYDGLFREVQQWACYFLVSLNEVSVVAGEPKKFADFCWVAGDGPVCDTFKFLWVHLYLTVDNDDTEIVDFFLFKVAFFGFKVQVVLF